LLPFDQRAATIARIPGVDLVIGFDSDTPELAIEHINPDILIKGAEYQGAVVPGQNRVIQNGGLIVYAPRVPSWHSRDIAMHLDKRASKNRFLETPV
jgi:D-beta-D-heptose 7-phosphate kinase/D-beta-D-heptose 1-phosphate adenosyltransferase